VRVGKAGEGERIPHAAGAGVEFERAKGWHLRVCTAYACFLSSVHWCVK
jgi:hypothetical protein